MLKVDIEVNFVLGPRVAVGAVFKPWAAVGMVEPRMVVGVVSEP